MPGNAVRVLRNASENYPAWLDALRAARHRVCFENYIFSDDATGRTFAVALAERPLGVCPSLRVRHQALPQVTIASITARSAATRSDAVPCGATSTRTGIFMRVVAIFTIS